MNNLFSLAGHTRPWGYRWLAALSVGIPIISGTLLNQFAYGLVAALGGLVIVYLPRTSLPHRLATLSLSAFGFCFGFTLALIANIHFIMSSFCLALVAFLATLVCRFYRMPPPGSFFFVMVCCMGITLPFDADQIMTRAGTLVVGTLAATLLAFLYSCYRYLAGIMVVDPPSENIFRPTSSLIFESVLAAIFIGGSYLLACLAGLENPYWIPISCSAILQAASLTHVLERIIQRVGGTLIGLLLAWLLLMLKPDSLTIGVMITLLIFLVETFITRNYALAIIFVTPATLFFAEATTHTDANLLIETRFFDILIGSCAGMIGGWLLHHPSVFKSFKSPQPE